ncbi:MAG: exo-alpha-sialidase, partial [Methylobacter sp.]|nr:exo-alpha-sialidase [Methylobacter sp.]
AAAEKIEAKSIYHPKIKLDAKGNIYLTRRLKLEGRHSDHVCLSRSTDSSQHFSAPRYHL